MTKTAMVLNRGLILLALGVAGCADEGSVPSESTGPTADFVLTADQTHDKFSRAIEPAVSVPSGSVIEAFTHEATGGQLGPRSTVSEFENVDMDRVHTLTGPIYVEGAEPGDVLAVKLLEIDPADWGWTGMGPDFGFLGGEAAQADFRTFEIDRETGSLEFAPGIRLPLQPFAGVMGVAPDTDEMLNTIPPRANGGNMDDPNIIAGTTVYFPVFAEGALFSIGDTHALQGLGEVAGTAVETPMRIVFQLDVIKGGRRIEEPQYETDSYYATTGFGTTLEEAGKKATRFMIDYLMQTHDLSWNDAYMLCSLAGDLKIAEVVDVPHMLVAMHMPKAIFVSDRK